MPSKTLVAAIAADALTGTVLTFVGLPGLMAITLVADARDFRLRNGLVPRRERRCEGRDDQMAHPYGGSLKCTYVSANYSCLGRRSAMGKVPPAHLPAATARSKSSQRTLVLPAKANLKVNK